jgi:hypothetical protein
MSEGKKYNFQKGGGGINIVFGPKYRPLLLALKFFRISEKFYI